MSFQLTPLNEEQFNQLNKLRNSLDDKQLFWLAGYLAGSLNQNLSPSQTNQISAKTIELSILFGSRTGNGESIAKIIAEQASANGIIVKLKNLSNYKPREIESETNVLLIVSTHGEGEPPFEAKEFYDYLHGKRAPNLAKLNFSVLGLGDSSYVNFCKTAKDFNQKFEDLGAARIFEPAFLDVDFKSKYSTWSTEFLKSLVPNSSAVQIESLTQDVYASKYSAENPFKAKLLEKIQLYGRGADRKVYHLELDTPGLSFVSGDALGVLPVNKDEKVKELIQLLSLDADSLVKVNDKEISLFDALKYNFEISKLTPDVIKRYNDLFPNEILTDLLGNSSALADYLKNTDLVEFWINNKQAIQADEFLSILRTLQPRLYSISSSSNAIPNEVHLTVGLVEYNSNGKYKTGVCSDYLANLDEDEELNVFVENNDNFRLPSDSSIPIIMIGAGTGIAPFRAFVQEREFQAGSGKSWLFFGNRNFETEFLYQTEWQQAMNSGSLSKLDLAFSRDGNDKVYVQHKLLENASEVFKWIQEGAYVYVCGDKSKLAGDVQTAVKQIIQQQSGLNEEDTESYFIQLIKDKRYQTDVY